MHAHTFDIVLLAKKFLNVLLCRYLPLSLYIPYIGQGYTIKVPKLPRICMYLQADLAAVVHLVAALNAWQAESQLASATQQGDSEIGVVPPTQMSLLLECGLTAQLQHIPQVMSCSPILQTHKWKQHPG